MEILVLLIPLGYLVFAVWAVWKIVGQATTKRRKQWLGGGASLIFLLVPTADEAWNRLQVVRLCHKDAGYHSYGKARDVTGFYSSRGIFDIRTVKKLGFDYLEKPIRYSPVKLARFTIDEYGEEVVTPIDQPSAPFEYGQQVSPEISAVKRIEFFVRARATEQPLQTYVTYSYSGGWVKHFLFGGMAFRGATCGSIDRPEFRVTEFLLSGIEPPKP